MRVLSVKKGQDLQSLDKFGVNDVINDIKVCKNTEKFETRQTSWWEVSEIEKARFVKTRLVFVKEQVESHVVIDPRQNYVFS